MAKSSKKSKEARAQESNPTALGMEPSDSLGVAEPDQADGVKKTAANSTARAKIAVKSRSSAPRKTTAARKPRAKKTAQQADAAVTDEEIRMRAYFISEWRLQNGITGDSGSDWLEAQRQLQEEAARA